MGACSSTAGSDTRKNNNRVLKKTKAPQQDRVGKRPKPTLALPTSADGKVVSDEDEEDSTIEFGTPQRRTRPEPKSARKYIREEEAANMMMSADWKDKPMTTSEFLGFLRMRPEELKPSFVSSRPEEP